MKRFISTLSLSISMFFLSLVAFAQEKKVDVDISLDKGNAAPANWMENPLYWVIGGLLFLLLIFIVTRGGKRD